MQKNVEHVEDTPSEGLIKTPRQLIVTIILAFLIPIIGIILLVKLVAVTSPMGAGSRAQSADSIAERIQPVANFVLVAETSEGSDESRTGEQVYELTCAACHAAGVAGAPPLGDEGAWAPLIETGFDEMVRIAIEGVGAMPPRGGNPSLSDVEVARAVAYMANTAGGSFDEPADDADAAGGDDADADAGTAAATAAAAEAAQADAAASDTDTASAEAADTTDAAQAAAGTAGLGLADVQPILTKNACLACHAVDQRMIGPSYREVAEKYADDAGAAETIAQHIKGGSSGIWGPIPMPPNPGITDDEIESVVTWLLDGAPEEAAAAQPAAEADTTAEDAAPSDDTAAADDAAASDDTAVAEEAAASEDTAATEDTAADASDSTDAVQEAATTEAAAPGLAEVQPILTKNACLACHAVDNRMIGPSYREVAEKYADDTGAAETIAQHIRGGSSGIWGPIPMPPNPGISDDEIESVVTWIQAGAPE